MNNTYIFYGRHDKNASFVVVIISQHLTLFSRCMNCGKRALWWTLIQSISPHPPIPHARPTLKNHLIIRARELQSANTQHNHNLGLVAKLWGKGCDAIITLPAQHFPRHRTLYRCSQHRQQKKKKQYKNPTLNVRKTLHGPPDTTLAVISHFSLFQE